MSEVIGGIQKLLEIIAGSTATTALSITGLLLLALTAALAYLAFKAPPDQKATALKVGLFVSLAGGIAFSAAGPGLALFLIDQKAAREGESDTDSVPRVSPESAFDNLATNERVNWVVRLVSYNPRTDPQLAVGELERLGPPKQHFSFVGDYQELVGYTAKEALQMTGGIYRQGDRISAIIFRLQTALYPANARGLLQVVQQVEARKDIEVIYKFFQENSLNRNELEDLEKDEIVSFRVENFKDKYPHYCELAYKFQCDRRYSARDFIGGLHRDWHPLGFSRRKIEYDPCVRPQEYCSFSDWPAAKKTLLPQFGSRAFLIRNLEISNIPGRILIDFDDPDRQILPDIGVRRERSIEAKARRGPLGH
ncbi:MAG: hypothetical protein QM576_22900 [Rhodopseudomonas sp.]|uniref:hypothetical protein n=1 Tax=Rhodopseudomonas sp. TaxID=1078 RepID=UPI0039E568D7